MKRHDNRLLVVTQTPAFEEHFRALFRGLESAAPSPDAAAISADALLSGCRIQTAASASEAVGKIHQAQQERHPIALTVVDVAGFQGYAKSLVQRFLGADKSMIVIGCVDSDAKVWTDLADALAPSGRFVIVRDVLFPAEVRQLLVAELHRHLLIREACHWRRVIDSNRRVLRRLREEAQQSRAMRDEFLANISHEMRTPLNAIMGFSSLLLDESLSPSAQAKTERIHDSAHALLRLIENLLDCASLGEGRLILTRAPFEMDAVLREAIEEVRPAAVEKGLAVECDVQHETPRRLLGDGRRFHQILSALLDNAIKFTPRGLIRVQTMVDEIGPANVLLRIVITDTGVGIPADRQSMIFASFAQADGSVTRQFGGVGLGLTLAKQLADLMDGQIGFRSAPEEGSCFWMSLPFDIPEGDSRGAVPWDAAMLPSILPQGHASGPTPALDAGLENSRPRILVSHAERLTRTMMEVILARTGGFIDVAAGAEQTMSLLEHRPYDLVVLDANVPGIDVAALQAALCDAPVGAAKSRRTIVVVSGDDVQGRAAWEGKADRVLTSPVSAEEFLESVHAVSPTLFDKRAGDSRGTSLRSPNGEPPEAATQKYVVALHDAVSAADGSAAETHARSLRDVALRAGWQDIGDDAMRLQLAARSGDDNRMRRALARLAGDVQHRFHDGGARPPV
jgi:signal transduction histidine kinase/CheY-like chemotaxis protein